MGKQKRTRTHKPRIPIALESHRRRKNKWKNPLRGGGGGLPAELEKHLKRGVGHSLKKKAYHKRGGGIKKRGFSGRRRGKVAARRKEVKGNDKRGKKIHRKRE